MRYLINLIKDFIAFYRSRRAVESIKLSGEIKTKLRYLDAKFDRELNGLCVDELSKMVIKEQLSREFVLGYLAALKQREGLLTTYQALLVSPLDK